ncbi:MAG: NifB/NifX family molybdenum-iron cluster-binding protein [Candidatus Omnitrophica bacterium]|nr:NifB/NifX family molybdenum-iron cluster-binding protein [Candidatus Omnitrophota bacterium]
MVKHPKEKMNVSIDDLSSRLEETDLNTYFIFGAILLVLAVGIFALFSPEGQTQNVGNPACGKIVIAATGSNLNANVAATLPEAKYFLVVDPLSKKMLESIKNPYLGTQPNPQLVYLIAGKGEEAVIVGNIDPDSYNILMQFGIRAFGGYTGQARKVVTLYRKARIQATPQASNTLPQPGMPGQMPDQNMGQAMPAPVAFGNGMGPNCPMPMGQGGGMMMRPAMMQQGVMMQPAMMQQGGMQGNGMMMQQAANQGNMPVAWNGGPLCPLPGNQNGIGQQVAFGFGPQQVQPQQVQPAQQQQTQGFICPVCNWRMKAVRQANKFPKCPNCDAEMALEMANNNNVPAPVIEQPVTNMVQFQQPQMNQMMPVQPNFDQGQAPVKAFVCPTCNWRFYARLDPNDGYPRCPNCKQMISQGGIPVAMPVNTQANAFPVAAQQVAAVVAPPIPSNANMPHVYRGVCTNCHQVMNAPMAAQNNQMMDNGQQANTARVAFGQAVR